MKALSYKNFVWPQNPDTYQEILEREPKYFTLDGEVYYDGMGPLRRKITGSGAFYGPEAYEQFKKLLVLAENDTPGNLEHPIWGVRYCYFTGLEMTQEPEAECVHYRFQFTEALENGTVPK